MCDALAAMDLCNFCEIHGWKILFVFEIFIFSSYSPIRTHRHGSILIRSVTLYGSMQMAQQSLSISLSSDFMFFVGILAIIRFATLHSCLWMNEKRKENFILNIFSTKISTVSETYRFSVLRLKISESLYIVEYQPYQWNYHEDDKWHWYEKYGCSRMEIQNTDQVCGV